MTSPFIAEAMCSGGRASQVPSSTGHRESSKATSCPDRGVDNVADVADVADVSDR